jgi:tetratricopeptide (TPR) repeat protein
MPAPAASPDIERGEKAMAAGDFDTAISAFEAALLATPDDMQAGSEYRQAVMKRTMKAKPKEGNVADFDKEIAFFEKLVAANPSSSTAFLNFGFSYVDKIPAAGSITQVILANTALTQFTKSIDLKPTWIALYTRGNSYLYWPKIFGRAQKGVDDLEKAYGMQKGQGKKSFYVRVYISLGDGYWKTDNMDKAKAIWKEGLAMFPDSQPLKDRIAKDGDALKEYIDNVLDPNKRVDTDLRELWTQGQ